MKAKKILITYLGNGNIKSQVSKEYLFNRVVSDLIEEGKIVADTMVTQREKRIRFADGSSVICVPFTMANKGMKVTHVFIDRELSELINGNEIIQENILPSVINWETENFDISDKDRRFIFSLEDGVLNLDTI